MKMLLYIGCFLAFSSCVTVSVPVDDVRDARVVKPRPHIRRYYYRYSGNDNCYYVHPAPHNHVVVKGPRRGGKESGPKQNNPRPRR